MPLRIGIDARLLDGENGGIQQTLIGLASGLSALTDGDERYYFLTYRNGNDWLKPYIGGNCHILTGPEIPFRKNFKKKPLGRIFRYLVHSIGIKAFVRVPVSDGRVEAADIDVMHFVPQTAFLTALPSIYTPHDLQFMVHPKYFTRRERAQRGRLYRIFCQRARVVIAMTEWGKRELIENLGLAPEKIVVIPWAAATEAYRNLPEESLENVSRKFKLPEKFLFYPAQTWPHKNHILLVEAIARLAASGVQVPVICSGKVTEHGKAIISHAEKLGVKNLIHFLGFVTPGEIKALFKLSRGLIFPSLYEGWGLPVQEAMAAGRPVACAMVGSLPFVANGAALLFDPESVQEMATAMQRIWTDDAFCNALVEKGCGAISNFSWENTARAYRDLYRRLSAQ